MNIINITLGVDTQPCSSITLGRRGENEVTQVVVDFSSWVEEFGAGVITLLAMRSKDTSAYPVVLTLDGNTATWDVTSTDTAYKGSGRAEYIYTVGEQIAKSVVFGTTVLQDIGEPSETPPDPYEEWLERLTELGAETQENAEAAQQSAEDAEQSAQEAAQEAANAEGYAEQAGESASAAQSAESASESARDEAQAAKASAESSATAASGSAASAASSATAAAGSASSACTSATAAGNAETQAEAAKTAAQAAQSAAEDAAADAQQAAQQAHVEYEQLSGEVDDLSDEVTQQKSAIEDLQALTNRKAGMLVDTASGSIASFVPDATIRNLLGVTVDIEPVQDLHGYDSPWPAGGGKNLLPIDSVFHDDNTGNIVIFDGSITGTYTLSVDTSGVTSAIAPNAAVCVITVDGENKYDISLNNRSHTYSGTITRILVFSAGSYTQYRGMAKFQLESGSTATSWTPYENICPISGWDAVEIDAAGVNLLPNDFDAYNIGSNYSYLSSVVKKGETARFVFVDKDTSVDISNCAIGFQTGVSQSQHVPTAYNWAISNGVVQSNKSNISFRGDVCDGVFIYPKTEAAFNALFSRFDIMVVLDSTATEYKPFAGNTYTIQLGQTVYGAKLTIAEDGSVTALIDRARVVYDGSDDETWGRHSSGSASAFAMKISLVHAFVSSNVNIISNYLTAISSSATWGNYDNWVSSSSGGVLNTGIKSITDVTTWRTYLANNPLEVCYELATPIEIQLDPVTISTISGQTNNVWADAVDVAVEYAADLKHYIDSKIAAAVAALS